MTVSRFGWAGRWRRGGSPGTVPVTRSVFISYRRGPTAPWAGRLADRFISRLGTDVVFLDVDSIPAGADFTETIEDRLKLVDTLIVLIGPDWLGVDKASGARRIDDPDDFVRREVALSIESGRRVIPVLVDGATMPKPSELPDDVAPLARRNAVVLLHDSFESTVQRLFGQMSLDGAVLSPRVGRAHSVAIAIACATLAAIGGGLLVVFQGGGDAGADTSASMTTSPSTTAPSTTSSSTTVNTSPGAAEGVVQLYSSTGRKLSPGAVTVPIITLTITPPDGAADHSPRVATVVVDGTYRFEGLAPGQAYELVASAPGYYSTTLAFDVNPDETTVADVVLSAAAGSLVGMVSTSDGPLGRVTVQLTSSYGLTRSTKTDSLGSPGSYSFIELETPATYSVEVRLDGYQSEVFSIELNAGELTRVLDVYLTPL